MRTPSVRTLALDETVAFVVLLASFDVIGAESTAFVDHGKYDNSGQGAAVYVPFPAHALEADDCLPAPIASEQGSARAIANLSSVNEKRVSGAGYGTTVVVLGVLLALMGIALGAWAFVLMAVPFIALGAVTIVRRDESRQTRIERAARYQGTPFGIAFACVVAVAFWGWAIVGGAPLMFVFAPLWTVIAAVRIWRGTHGGRPLITRNDAT